jgi:hypothetical protein
VQFSSSEKKFFFIVKRENYSKKGDNGIGIQMFSLLDNAFSVPQEDLGEERKNSLQDVYWYQVTESLESKEVLCAKWTTPLLLGTALSASIIVKVFDLFKLFYFFSLFFLFLFLPPNKLIFF